LWASQDWKHHVFLRTFLPPRSRELRPQIYKTKEMEEPMFRGSYQYHFVTRWRVEANAQEVYDVISDPLQFPRWWRCVYRSVTEIEAGDSSGIGRCLSLHTKGWLPYALRWESVTLKAFPPHLIAIRAEGDLGGRGVWRFEQSGTFVDISFDWRVTAAKPLLRRLSFVCKPVFAANHRWAMRKGLECLKAELVHRRSLAWRASA